MENDELARRRAKGDATAGVYLILGILATFIYFWIWLYSLTNVQLILDSNSIKNHTSHNISLERHLSTIRPTTTRLLEMSYTVTIDKEKQKYNYGALGVLAFWTLFFTIFTIYILDCIQNSASFLLQQMLFINLGLFSAGSTMTFLCNFSDIYTDAFNWCQKLKIYGDLSFSISLGSALSLAFYHLLKGRMRNRDYLEVSGFARFVCFLVVGILCSMSNVFAVGVTIDIVIFSIAILIAIISTCILLCTNLREVVAGIILTLFLSLKTVLLQLDPIVRLPCDCFHQWFDSTSCGSETISYFISDTNSTLAHYSAFATIFSLFYPFINTVFVIVFLPGVREKFSDIFLLPEFFNRGNENMRQFREPLLNEDTRENNTGRDDQSVNSNSSSDPEDVENGYFTPDEDSDISQNMYNDPHGERYMQIEPGYNHRGHPESNAQLPPPEGEIEPQSTANEENHVDPECNAHGPRTPSEHSWHQ